MSSEIVQWVGGYPRGPDNPVTAQPKIPVEQTVSPPETAVAGHSHDLRAGQVHATTQPPKDQSQST